MTVVFSVPGIVIASVLVSVPYVAREVMPVLGELGTSPAPPESAASAAPPESAATAAPRSPAESDGSRLRTG